MRSLLLTLLAVVCLAPATASAKPSSKFRVFGLYGMETLNPADINNLQNAFTAPKPGAITVGNSYGGGLGLRMGDKWELAATWEQMTAKNLATDTDGFTIMQTMVWADLNYYIKEGKSFFMYLGAGGGYALGSDVNRKNTTITEFTGEKVFGGEGKLGFGFMLGKHFSLFFEGGYQYYFAPSIVADVGGAKLAKVTSGNATLDLSGAKGNAGLAIHF